MKKMKNILAAIAMVFLCLCATAQTFNAQFFLSNFSVQPASVSLITLTPLQADYNYTNSLLAPIPIPRVTDQSGQVTFSNIQAGYSYQLDLVIAGAHYLFTNNFPVGLTGTVNAQPYTGFWIAGTQPQIFAYFTAPLVTYATNLTILNQTNVFNLTNNISGTNFYVAVGTNIFITTNGFTFTFNVPTQTQLTNPLSSAAYFSSNSFASSLAFNSGTNSVAQGATAGILAQGIANTNFTVSSTNAVYIGVGANLISASNSLQASIISSNASALSALANASNSILSAAQHGSITLSNLATTGAQTNGVAQGTNASVTTNVLNQIVFSVPWQTYLTNPLQSAAYYPSNAFVPTTGVFGITNGFTSNQGFATTNQLSATNTAILTVATNLVQGSALSSSNFSLTVYSNNPAGYLQSPATNRFVLGSTATNSFDPTNSASLAAMSALQTATNTFDRTNTATLVYSNNPKGYITGFVATNSFDATNTAANIYFGNPAHYLGIVGVAALVNTTVSNLVPPMITGSGIVYSNTFDVTNAAANAYTNAINTASNFFFLKLAGGTVSNYLGLGTKTNWLVTTNLINIYGVPGLPVLGDYMGLPFGLLWTNINNPAETIQYAAPNFFMFTNYGNILLYQSSDAVHWQVAGSGVAPAPIGAFGSKWRIGGIIDGYLNSTDLTQQIARYVATNSGGGVFTNAGTNFLLGQNAASVVGGFTTNNNFTTAGSNTIIAIVIANATNPTNGITLAQATNVVTGMTNVLTTQSLMTNYVQQATNPLASIVYVNNGTSSIINLINSGLPYIASQAGSGTNTSLSYRAQIGVGHQYYTGTGNPDTIANQSVFLGGTSNTFWTRDDAHGGFDNSAIVGGQSNTISQFDWRDANDIILGGTSNRIDTANDAIAMGVNSRVTHHNTFMWNDGPAVFASTQTNTFLIHSLNGFGINTNATAGYAENVHGAVQSDVGFYVNGVLVSGSGGSATNAIGNNAGFGTNTTLLGTNYFNTLAEYTVPVTNVAGIPIMSSDTAPSGTVTSSSQNDSVNHPDWAAMGYPSAGDWQSLTEYDQWIQYQSAAPITANCFQVQINGGTSTQPFALQTSPDGINWFNAYFNGAQTWLTGNLVTNYFPLTTSSFWRWNFYNVGSPGGSIADISHLQLYQVAVNYLDAGTNAPIVINSPVTINTTFATNNSQLEVNGNADASSMSIQGVPIASLILQYINSLSINGLAPVFSTSYTVSGGVSNSVVSNSKTFNGNYTYWIDAPQNQTVFLNSQGEKFGLVIAWSANQWPVGIPTNVYAIFNFNRGQFYTNGVANNPVGAYTAYGSTTPSNSMTIVVTGSSTYLQSASGSPYDGSALTNFNISQLPVGTLTNGYKANVEFKQGFTVRGEIDGFPTNISQQRAFAARLPIGGTADLFDFYNTNGSSINSFANSNGVWSASAMPGYLQSSNDAVLSVANPSGNYLTDFNNSTSTVAGQLLVTTAHNGVGQDNVALWGSAIAGNSTNGFSSAFSFPQGIIDVGNKFWTDTAPAATKGPGDGFQYMSFNWGAGPSNSALERVWGTNAAGLVTNSSAFQPYLNVNGWNPWSGGAGINIRSASTNSARGAFRGNDADGNAIYMSDWGMMLAYFGDALKLPTNGGFYTKSMEFYQLPSYQTLLNDQGVPYVIGWNFITRNGDENIGGTRPQIPAFYIDPTQITAAQPNFIIRFPFQKPTVYDPRYDTAWEDALRVDEWSNIVTVGNQLLVKTNETIKGNLTIASGPIFGYQALLSDKVISTNNGFESMGGGGGFIFDDRTANGHTGTWFMSGDLMSLYSGGFITSWDRSGDQTNAGSVYATTVGFTVTNTILPVVPVSGQAVLAVGGPGGTNLYLVFKDSGGNNRTNKISAVGGFP